VDLQGTEWIIPVYEVLMLVVPVIGFIALRRRVKRQLLTTRRAFMHYAGLVISPVAMYLIFFLGLVGLEEVSKTAIVSEGLARSLPLLSGLGLLVWLQSMIVFGIAVAFCSRLESSAS
jgi:hypothetical protein